MVFSNPLGVTTFLLVFLVKGVECWTVTHSYAAAGGGFTLMFIFIFIRCCIRSYSEAGQRPSARRCVIVREITQQGAVVTSGSPTNPYNAGYDQPGKTLSSPPPYDQIDQPPTSANPSPSDPYNAGYDQNSIV